MMYEQLDMTRSLTKFACLDCQRVFKRPADATQKTCPRCGGITYRTGSDFRPPSATDNKAWAVAAFLISHGFPYYRLGIRYPATLKEAAQFIEVNAAFAVEDGRNISVPLRCPRDARL